MIKSTPRGLMTSSFLPGSMWASSMPCPRAPMLFKQILMVGGMDKYFQIARCY